MTAVGVKSRCVCPSMLWGQAIDNKTIHSATAQSRNASAAFHVVCNAPAIRKDSLFENTDHQQPQQGTVDNNLE